MFYIEVLRRFAVLLLPFPWLGTALAALDIILRQRCVSTVSGEDLSVQTTLQRLS